MVWLGRVKASITYTSLRSAALFIFLSTSQLLS
eukprot:gene21939-28407_t